MSKKSGRMVAVGICWACGLACLALGAEDPARTQDWRVLLLSPEQRDRDRAAALVMQERKTEVSDLLKILAMPVQPDEPFLEYHTPRNIAIRLVGELRAEEAIEPLVQWLTPKPGMSLEVDEAGPVPAGAALFEIGAAAVPALLDALATVGVSAERGAAGAAQAQPAGQRYSPLGDECLWVLVRILGLEEAEVRLRRAVAEETDAVRKSNLGEAVFALSRPKLRASLQGLQKHDEAVQQAKWRGWWAKHVEDQAKREAVPPQDAQPVAAPPKGPAK